MDLNYDGRLDLLVMAEVDDSTWWTESKELQLDVHLQDGSGGFGAFPSLTSEGLAAGLNDSLCLISRSGRRRLASEIVPGAASDRRHQRRHATRSSRSCLGGWREDDVAEGLAQPGGLVRLVRLPSTQPCSRASVLIFPFVYRQDSPLNSTKTCKLATPHSSAFIDLDGDCLAGASSDPLHSTRLALD